MATKAATGKVAGSSEGNTTVAHRNKPAPSASPVETMSGTMLRARHTGTPVAALRIIAWQSRKTMPSTAAATVSAALPDHSAASATGKNAAAVHASRVI